ncbi:MAG: hypothetical protein JJU40_04935 [Rhodobacteraceae bacterium]|nr:hypothetical protein [Paracoccaceae bacterium]
MTRFRQLMAGAAIVAVSAGLAAGSAQAQSQSELERLTAQLESALAGQSVAIDVRRRAGIAAVPSGFGLSGGTASVSLSGSYGPPRGPDNTRFDASTAIAAGFGNPATAVGVEVGLVNTSFRRFGHSGFFTLGVNRQFPIEGGTGSVSVSASNIAGWGDSRNNPVAGTIVASFAYSINGRPVMATIGAGSRLTRNNEAGIIAGFGMSVAPDWAISAGVVGDSPIIGASYFPPMLEGASVNFSLRDFDRGSNTVFGVDLGYAFNLFGR